MTNGKKQSRGAGIGMASVLMIIVVLALTCIGVLSLSSALSDTALSESSVRFASRYYAAESGIQRQIAELDEKYSEGVLPFKEGDKIYLTENMTEDKILEVTVLLVNSENGVVPEIIHSELVDISEWSPDDSINIWDGGE